VTVLALVGPTATGKSGLAIEVARGRPVEIVAIDALTLYRGLDVATAKPSPADRAVVPHHLIDVLDPWGEATVAWFQVAARAALDDIRGRGATPLLVGGSGLYLRAVVDDLDFPPTDPSVRSALEARYTDDPTRAHADLADVDPLAASRIDPMNLRRSVRALEVIAITGAPFSASTPPSQVVEPLEVRGVDLPDDDLRRRVRERAERMVAGGLLDEAAGLRELDRPLSRTAREAIGYAEAFRVLDGTASSDTLVDAIATRTWGYVRRQRGWFRREPRVVWSTPDQVRTAFGVPSAT